MQSRNFGVGNNPINESPFTLHSTGSVISPGNQQFIATENYFTITTEDGIGLVTEG